MVRSPQALFLLGWASLALALPVHAQHVLEYRPAVKADARDSACLGGKPGKAVVARLQAGGKLPVGADVALSWSPDEARVLGGDASGSQEEAPG